MADKEKKGLKPKTNKPKDRRPHRNSQPAKETQPVRR